MNIQTRKDFRKQELHAGSVEDPKQQRLRKTMHDMVKSDTRGRLLAQATPRALQHDVSGGHYKPPPELQRERSDGMPSYPESCLGTYINGTLNPGDNGIPGENQRNMLTH